MKDFKARFHRFGIAVMGMLVLVLLVFFLIAYSFFLPKQIDTCLSPDCSRELVLQKRSHNPQQSYGVLVLRQKGHQPIGADFSSVIDVNNLHLYQQDVTWSDDRVQACFGFSHQPQVQVTIWFDGRTQVDVKPVPEAPLATPAPALSWEDQEYIEWAGYRAIFDQFFGGASSFTEGWDAKGHSQVILSEDDSAVELLVYDRQSANGACALYVHWRCPRGADGTWSLQDGAMQNTFAYVIADGQVIPSGKTGWAEPSYPSFQAITGEN